MTELSPRERQIERTRLQRLAERLKHQAVLIQNGAGDSDAERHAGKLQDEAFAIGRLLAENATLRIERETGVELPGEVVGFLADMGG